MTKKTLSFFLTLCLAVSIVGVSLAEFDYSVFEQNEKFQIDTMGDRVTISLASKEDTVLKSEAGALVNMDILKIPDFPVVIRMEFIVLEPFVNANRVMLLADKTRYTVKAISNINTNTDTSYEVIMFGFAPSLFPFIEEIIDKNLTSVRFRLSGENSKDGNFSVNVEMLKLFYESYKSAGGLTQDFHAVLPVFTVIEVLTPVDGFFILRF